MQFAEDFAFPVEVEIGRDIPRTNDFKDLFYVRWGAIRFDAFWGEELNLKVVLKVYRADGTCEQFIADTDAYDVRWDRHRRATRDFYVHPFSMKLGHISHVGFSFLCHLHGRSIRSRHEYIFMDGHHLGDQHPQRRHITLDRLVPNTYRTHELDAPASCSAMSTGSTIISSR